jgi:hypothetical protein
MALWRSADKRASPYFMELVVALNSNCELPVPASRQQCIIAAHANEASVSLEIPAGTQCVLLSFSLAQRQFAFGNASRFPNSQSSRMRYHRRKRGINDWGAAR